MRAIKTLKRGFTLVELMIVVAIIGVLAALAIYGVRRYLSNAKTAEASANLGRLASSAVEAFSKEKMEGTVLPLGDEAEGAASLCASAATTVPAAIAQVAGSKYQSSPAEWRPAAETPSDGWRCLGFMLESPQYYMYSYTMTGTGVDVDDTFVVAAEGDLDADGITSKFERNGQIQEEANEISITLSPTLIETNPDE